MAVALWPATWGYALGRSSADCRRAALAQARGHVVGHVRGAGPLPALRVGRQPYGVLPATSLSRFAPLSPSDLDADLPPILRALAGVWRAAVADVPRVTPTAAIEDVLSAALTMSPTSVAYAARPAALQPDSDRAGDLRAPPAGARRAARAGPRPRAAAGRRRLRPDGRRAHRPGRRGRAVGDRPPARARTTTSGGWPATAGRRCAPARRPRAPSRCSSRCCATGCCAPTRTPRCGSCVRAGSWSPARAPSPGWGSGRPVAVGAPGRAGRRRHRRRATGRLP